MDLALSEEQLALQNSVRSLVQDLFPTSAVRTCESDPVKARTVYDALFALGLGGLLVPEALGGVGLGMADLVVVQMELGNALVPALFTQSTAGVVTAVAVAMEKSGDQVCAPVLDSLISGTALATFGLGMQDDSAVTASLRDGTLLLNGSIDYVPEMALADWLLVNAIDDAGRPVLCFVGANTAGIGLVSLPNLADQDMSRVTLSDVPASFVLARGEVAAEAVDAAQNALKLATAAQAVGGTARVFEMTREYACTRQQFGQPIGGFQAIAHMLAEGVVNLEGASVMVHRAAAAMDERESDADTWVDMAKLKACQVYRDVSAMAVQVHGGIGFTLEADPQLFFRRAKFLQLMQGEPLDLMENIGSAVFQGAHKVLESNDQ